MKKRLFIFLVGTYLNTLVLFSSRKAGKEGFLLFCRPRRRAVKPHHLEFLNTAERFIVNFDGKKVQAYRWGNGPKKLLLLHGWESHSYWWKSIVTHLSKEKFTLYSVDAPAHGLSEGHYINMPYYSELIEKMISEYGRFDALLGHSFGAFSMIYTFHRTPKLGTPKLVIMASPGEVTEFVVYYQRTLGLSRQTMDAVRAYFEEAVGQSPSFFSLKEFVKTLHNEGLIIHDKNDYEAPFLHALEAHHNWHNSKMITTSGLGHNLKSTELISEVEKFLDA
ncbi:MAG: alpha/beta hydrolase [Bacteroidetes bacterium]|nr:alpha/beta hydrolase [Bacteroidota bacterium]